MKRYSIGEVSKKLGVTSSFLKYYEQHGVLDPHVAQNGYRSYEGRHLSVVQECVKLRNLGYSAAEIRSMLNSPYEETLDALEAKQEALERQICYLKYAKKYISMAREEAHFFHEDPCWTVDEHGDFFFLAQIQDFNFIEDERFFALAGEWNQWLPAVRVAACVNRGHRDGPKIIWGLAMPMAFARAMNLTYGEPAMYVPPMRCLEVFDRRPIGDGLNDRGLEGVRTSMLARVNEVIEQHQFTPLGPSYFFVRAKLKENGERVTYQKVLTPVL